MSRKAWLKARKSNPTLHWVSNMIRGVGAQHFLTNVLPCPCLSSAAAKGVFCRKRWPVGYLQCRSVNNFFPISSIVVDDHCSLADGLSQCSWSGPEASQRFSLFSEVQNSVNRGNMRHGNGFSSEADRACIYPSSQGRFNCFCNLINFLN